MVEIYHGVEEWCEKNGYPTRGDIFEMNVADDTCEAEDLLHYVMEVREHRVSEVAEILSFICDESYFDWYVRCVEMRGDGNMDHKVFITLISKLIMERSIYNG